MHGADLGPFRNSVTRILQLCGYIAENKQDLRDTFVGYIAENKQDLRDIPAVQGAHYVRVQTHLNSKERVFAHTSPWQILDVTRQAKKRSGCNSMLRTQGSGPQ